MNLKIEFANKYCLDEVWANCNNIAQTMAYPSFFCSEDWLRIVSESIGRNEELSFLLIKCDGKITAILPLVKKYNILGGKDFHFLGAKFFPDPVGLICSESDRAEYAGILCRTLLNLSDWDRFFFDYILKDELDDWNIAGKPITVAPFKVLSNNFEDILTSFKKKKRYNLRAMVSRFFDSGGSFEISSDVRTNGLFLKELFLLHKKRACEKSIKSSIIDVRVQALHSRLAIETESVRLFALRLNDQFVAVIYGFEFCNRFFFFQVAHDPVFGKIGPGSILLYLVMENCCQKGIKEFNFLQGDESYKYTWTQDSRVLFRGVLKNNTWRAKVLDSLEGIKEYWKKVGR